MWPSAKQSATQCFQSRQKPHRRWVVYVTLLCKFSQIFIQCIYVFFCGVKDLLSVLWHCWLGGRKGIRPVKNWMVGCWHGYLSGARCRLAYGLTFLVLAHLGSPRQRAVKWVWVWHKGNMRSSESFLASVRWVFLDVLTLLVWEQEGHFGM